LKNRLGQIFLRDLREVFAGAVAGDEKGVLALGGDGLRRVGDDQVEALGLEFAPRAGRQVFRFQAEADEDLPRLAAAHLGEDVGRRLEFQRDLPIALLGLAVCACGGTVIGDGCGCDKNVAGVEARRDRIEHLGGARDGDKFVHLGRLEGDRAADKRDAVSLRHGGGCQGGADPPAGGVRDVPDGVEVLARRAGGNENAHPASPRIMDV